MRLETISRLHFGLIDLHGGMGRVDGGCGLAIARPSIVADGELDDQLRVEGPLSSRIRDGAKNVLEHIGGDPVSITVERGFPQHVGLGSGTQAALVGAYLASRLNGAQLPISELSRLVGRGGTSGIGTAAFEGGGFVVDGGHNFEAKGGFFPSSASSVSPPPVTSRLEFPDWRVAVIVPEGKGSYGSDEIELFDRVCPIPEEEVDRLCRIILMELLPSIASANFEDFRTSVARLQNVGFKQRELSAQPRSRDLVETMNERGYASGMSSLGPAVYAIHPKGVDTTDLDETVYKTKASNVGALVLD